MAAGNVLSGKSGYVVNGSTTLDHIGKWSLTDMVTTHDFATNSTGGRKRRVVGTGDATGSFEGMMHDGGPIPVKSGDSVTLKLYVNSSNYYTLPVVIQQVETEVDANDGTPVGYTATFEGNGVLTPTGSSLT